MRPNSVLMAILCMVIIVWGTAGLHAAQAESKEIKDAAGQTLLWETKMEEEIVDMRLIDENNLLVCSDSTIFAIRTESGEIRWLLKYFTEVADYSIFKIPETDLFVVEFAAKYLDIDTKSNARNYYQRHHIVIADITNGEILWHSMDEGIYTTKGLFFLPPIHALMIYAADSSDNHWMMALDYRTRKTIWKNEDFFAGCKPNLFRIPGKTKTLNGNQYPIFDTEETMITFLDKGSLKKWNLLTGELIWESEINAKKLPAIADLYSPMMLSKDRKILYVPYDRTLMAVRTDDGSKVWPAGLKLPSGIHQIFKTRYGLLVKGGPIPQVWGGKPFLTVLNELSGQPVWDKEFTKFKAKPNILLDQNRVVVYSDRKMCEVSLEDGSYKAFEKLPKFKGSEHPIYLMWHDKGYLLLSAQNLMVADDSGNLVYHVYHEPPGLSFMDQFALAFGSMVFSMVGAGLASGGSPSPSYIPMYYPPELSYKFKATRHQQEYVYMLTMVETRYDKGPGLVKVETYDGMVESKIVLDDRTPMYLPAIDRDWLFFVRGGTTLQCYDF